LTTSFVGGTGIQGVAGYNGWTPQINLFPFTNNTILLKIVNWFGGSGTKPAVDQYILPTGLSATASESGNIRGLSGASGPGLIGSDYWESPGEIYNENLTVSAGTARLQIRKAKSGVVYFNMQYLTGNFTYVNKWSLPSKYRPSSTIHFWANAWYSSNILDNSQAFISFTSDFINGPIPEPSGSRFTFSFWGVLGKQVSISGSYMTEGAISNSISTISPIRL